MIKTCKIVNCKNKIFGDKIPCVRSKRCKQTFFNYNHLKRHVEQCSEVGVVEAEGNIEDVVVAEVVSPPISSTLENLNDNNAGSSNLLLTRNAVVTENQDFLDYQSNLKDFFCILTQRPCLRQLLIMLIKKWKAYFAMLST